MAVNSRLAIEPRLRLRRALRRAALVRLTLISTTRRAPRPRTRTIAFGRKAAAPCGTVGVVAELAVVEVELVVEVLCVVVVVVMGSVGTVGEVTPGRGKVGKVVVTQPTPGKQT